LFIQLKSGRQIVAVGARMSNQVHLRFADPKRDYEIRSCSGWTGVFSQLQPWLVPHSVQTPQAPARMTLSLPQTEQVMPMKMLPSATVTRSDEAPLPFPVADFPPFP
jgi:hypothetical protein